MPDGGDAKGTVSDSERQFNSSRSGVVDSFDFE